MYVKKIEGSRRYNKLLEPLMNICRSISPLKEINPAPTKAKKRIHIASLMSHPSYLNQPFFIKDVHPLNKLVRWTSFAPPSEHFLFYNLLLGNCSLPALMRHADFLNREAPAKNVWCWTGLTLGQNVEILWMFQFALFASNNKEILYLQRVNKMQVDIDYVYCQSRYSR